MFHPCYLGIYTEYIQHLGSDESSNLLHWAPCLICNCQMDYSSRHQLSSMPQYIWLCCDPLLEELQAQKNPTCVAVVEETFFDSENGTQVPPFSVIGEWMSTVG